MDYIINLFIGFSVIISLFFFICITLLINNRHTKSKFEINRNIDADYTFPYYMSYIAAVVSAIALLSYLVCGEAYYYTMNSSAVMIAIPLYLGALFFCLLSMVAVSYSVYKGLYCYMHAKAMYY